MSSDGGPSQPEGQHRAVSPHEAATTQPIDYFRAPVSLLLDINGRLAVIETQNLSIISEQSEARASRNLLHQKQDDIAIQLGALNQLKTQLEDKSLPQLAEHERFRQKFIGGVAVLVALGSVVMVGVGFVLKEAWGWIGAHIRWR